MKTPSIYKHRAAPLLLGTLVVAAIISLAIFSNRGELAKHMVDYPDQVEVRELDGNQTMVLELSVAKEDLGKIIGMKGRNIQAIRTVMMAASGKIHRRIVVELVE